MPIYDICNAQRHQDRLVVIPICSPNDFYGIILKSCLHLPCSTETKGPVGPQGPKALMKCQLQAEGAAKN